ncbi:MAG: phosphoserine phosphatase RsbU/P [Chthoniobacter sp.]|jgi:sigma-B regulation protein RsbU (phosphoserine phosphatase)|nr:phosphoserine phosphatase RsbU/P [Chthoniobacter sp.]
MSNEGFPQNSDTTVLIVEDSLTQALKLQHVLERHEYKVIAAANGREALAKLETQMPTLVITDINMPEMNGYELCERIKDNERLKDLPVILLTSLSDPKDILKGLECGADNFISKPYDDEFLLSRIQHVLANMALRREAGGKQPSEIFFAGHKYELTADRIHSIDLLLSTYETAVQKNLELSRAKEKLETQAEELREKNAQMTEELHMAKELQTAFLPKKYPALPIGSTPEQSAVQFCFRYSTTDELGGDFFDVLPLSGHEAGVFICDVMGHGVRAALVTAIVRGLVEELKSAATDAGAFLTAINQSLCAILAQTATPLFASAFYAVADLARGEVRFANAGHPSAFHLRRAEGRVELLKDGKPGPVLGVFEHSTYATVVRPLAAGDLVVLFTDGLYEIEAADGSLYDTDQLKEAVTRQMNLPASELFDALLAEVRSFSAHEGFEDDVCLVGMEVPRLMRPGG